MKTVCFDCAKCSDLILGEYDMPAGKIIHCRFVVCDRGNARLDLIPRVECPYYEVKKVKTCFNCHYFRKRTDDAGGWCLEYTHTLSYNECLIGCGKFEEVKKK